MISAFSISGCVLGSFCSSGTPAWSELTRLLYPMQLVFETLNDGLFIVIQILFANSFLVGV